MRVINPAIFIILERFPNRTEAIKRLFSESDHFQNACEDYRQCSDALRHWNHSMEADAPARRQEYSALLSDLEQEIIQRLNEAA